jgi:DNA-binding MarR family transcriptional regulator
MTVMTADDLEDVPLPALLRAARATFGTAIRRDLEDAGCDDVPPNGPFVLGALARRAGAVPLADVIRQLGISKQSAGQLVDTLVARGYLEREADPVDRRRLVVRLTPRGADAAGVVREAVDAVGSALSRRVGREAVATTRHVLAALIDLGAGDG